MQRITLLICVFSLWIGTASAQEVPEEQRSLISKVTATWCINCGTWGWDFFRDLIDETSSDQVVMMATHYSGDLVNPTSSAIVDNFSISGQPRFMLGTEDQNVTSGSTATKLTQIKNTVEADAQNSPVANAGILAELSNGMILVSSKTKFFQEADGEFYLAVYVVEDNLVNTQSGQGANALHKHILRAGMSADAFGTELMNGNIAAGTEFEREFELAVDPSWNLDNVELVTVIWQKVNNKYEFVNANPYDGELTTIVSINELAAAGNQVRAWTETGSGNLQVNLTLTQAVDRAQIEVYDFQGQLLDVVHSGELDSGEWRFESQASNWATGIYIVQLVTERGTLTEKVWKP